MCILLENASLGWYIFDIPTSEDIDDFTDIIFDPNEL